jgi:hypothetical protein
MRSHERLMRRLAALALAPLLLAATAVAQDTPRAYAPAAAAASAKSQPTPEEQRKAAAAAQRRRELEDLQRHDAAAALARMGVQVDGRHSDLRALLDWCARVEAASALRAEYRVEVDWRATSLRELQEMRLRATKAATLAAIYGVEVDWQRYTWRELEDLRRALAHLRPDLTPAARDRDGAAFANRRRLDDVPPGGLAFGDGLVAPGAVGPPRKLGTRPRDPDAIIEPTFAYQLPAPWARSPITGRLGRDADAILIPSFNQQVRRRPPVGKDDVIDPWQRPRPTGSSRR